MLACHRLCKRLGRICQIGRISTSSGLNDIAMMRIPTASTLPANMSGTRSFKSGRPTLIGKDFSARRTMSHASINDQPRSEKVDLDWDNIEFKYSRTDFHLEFTWKDGSWNEGEIVSDEFVKVHVMSGALHYGQQLFEGMKAFECKDGAVRVFQPNDANALRLQAGCRRLCMPEIPITMFNDALLGAVRANLAWVPPYGKGSLYIRPFIFGVGPQLGLAPSPEYKFIVQVMPVGSYYGDGFEGLDALVMTDFDRAAPKGTGDVKCGGNYGSDLLPNKLARSRGYQICLYTDAESGTFIEEFSTSNFVAISADGAYITPKSSTVLNSVTNRALMHIAKDSGMVVEKREIPVSELASMKEVAAIGTAVVLNPIKSVTWQERTFQYPIPSTLNKIRDQLFDIQLGNIPDPYGWTATV